MLRFDPNPLPNLRYKLSLISGIGFLLRYFSSSLPGRSLVLVSLRTRLINNATILRGKIFI